MSGASLHRLAAFTDHPDGGNPAGVWIGEDLPGATEMQRIAVEVGYSETAFLVPARGRARTVRYFAPEAEVSFCGHATIAAGVVLGEAEGDGTYHLATPVGEVPVTVTTVDGVREAALVSVDPRQEPASAGLVGDALSLLGWTASELDPGIPPVRAYAGAWHLVLAAATRARLDSLEYDFDGLRDLMLREGLTTLQLVWRETEEIFHARNPFPVGGVVEDPATGAAAAALGGYLRDSGIVRVPATFLVLQGEAMGRPSRLRVDMAHRGGIRVSGTAVRIPDPSGTGGQRSR